MSRVERIATATALAMAVSLGVSLLLAAPARAQEVNLARLDEGPANRVYVRTGAEWAFVMGVGYARTASVARHPMLLVGELSAPWVAANTSDYQSRLGVLAPIVGWGRLAAAAEGSCIGRAAPVGLTGVRRFGLPLRC